jgi:hypothetical protein
LHALYSLYISGCIESQSGWPPLCMLHISCTLFCDSSKHDNQNSSMHLKTIAIADTAAAAALHTV